MSNRKKRETLPRDLEIRGAEMFGKHVSPEKQRALLIVTLAACALPMILGGCGTRFRRLWKPA